MSIYPKKILMTKKSIKNLHLIPTQTFRLFCKISRGKSRKNKLATPKKWTVEEK